MGVCAVNNRTHEVHPPKNQEGTGRILPGINLKTSFGGPFGTIPLFSIGEMLRYLMRAAEVRARSDPEAYARELFNRMIGFNSFLLLRTQIHIADRVVGRGPLPTASSLAD